MVKMTHRASSLLCGYLLVKNVVECTKSALSECELDHFWVIGAKRLGLERHVFAKAGHRRHLRHLGHLALIDGLVHGVLEQSYKVFIYKRRVRIVVYITATSRSGIEGS